jgi:hypothetical protein
MSVSSWEPEFREPGRYSDIINPSCGIVCGEEGFGKARLMREAHKEVSDQDNLSVMLTLNAGTAYENLYQKIRDATAARVWDLLEAQPARFANVIRHPYFIGRMKSLLHEWMHQRGDDLDNELLRLDSVKPAHSNEIQAFMVARAQTALSRNPKSLGTDLMACADGLFDANADPKPDVYLWIRLEDDVDWRSQGVQLRELLCDAQWVRGPNRIRLKVFVTPAGLRELDRMQVDSQIERIALTWRQDLLHGLGEEVCRRVAKVSFAQLVDARRFNDFCKDYDTLLPRVPGAWIAFAHVVGALSQQFGCRVLSDEHWRLALTEYCRRHRRLRMRDGKLYAFGCEIGLEPKHLEVLQVIADWQCDPQKVKQSPRPSAKQVLAVINQRRREQGRKQIRENAVYTCVNRIRNNPHFEPTFHYYSQDDSDESKALAEQHLVYLKNEGGYFLDHFDL